MRSSQLISDLDVMHAPYGVRGFPLAHPVVVFRGDGSMLGAESESIPSSRSEFRKTLVGLGDHLDDAFVDAIRSAAFASDCDEDDRPTLRTPIPAVTVAIRDEVDDPPLPAFSLPDADEFEELPASERTPSRSGHMVLLDGVHDHLAASYLREAERIVELSLYPGARRSLRQRLQDAVEWLTRCWSRAWATAFD